MFVMSIKLSRKRILVGLAALVLVVGVGTAGMSLLRGDEAMASVTPVAEGPQAKPPKSTAKTGEDRLAFVQSFGWEVAPDPVEVLEVIIPKEFDQVYQQYNAIQQQQGYNLEKFAGKRCKRYAFVVTNYPGVEGEVRISLLVHSNKVIGGDVCSMEPGGFMHGFAAQ